MTPDVQLSLLTAAGLLEAREDWSQSGRDNLARAVADVVTEKGHTASALGPNTAMDGRIGQVIRLNSAVGASILSINYFGAALPTHKQTDFSWTPGEGTQELATQYNADYALFVTARGSNASDRHGNRRIDHRLAGADFPSARIAGAAPAKPRLNAGRALQHRHALHRWPQLFRHGAGRARRRQVQRPHLPGAREHYYGPLLPDVETALNSAQLT
jgi:hypothetical protein